MTTAEKDEEKEQKDSVDPLLSRTDVHRLQALNQGPLRAAARHRRHGQ
jgi:hypothetical protein